jgi:lipid-binding SYLF domain-containing protein
MRNPFTVLAVASITTLSWLSLDSTLSATSPTWPEDDLLRQATLVFERAVDTPTAAIPPAIMMRARGVAVIPVALKVDTKYGGLGVLSAQGANPTHWTPPAMIAFEGGIPLDLETDALDFILVAQTARGLDHLSQPRFVSPVIRPMVPGPVGQNARAHATADLLAYMQFGDYLAGVTVEDWMITEIRSSNAQLYGRPYSTDDIIRGNGFFFLPPAARRWRDALSGYFSRMS